jgi:hypothetical protein
MPYLVQASFQTTVREGITREEVRKAFAELIDGHGCAFLKAESLSRDRVCWFDGHEVGVSVGATVSRDFEEAFDQAALNIAAISSEAFETSHINDDQMTDRERCRVLGPTEQSVREFILQQRLAQMGDIAKALSLSPVIGISASQIAAGGIGAVVTEEKGDEGATLVATINMDALSLTSPQRQAVAVQFETLARLLSSFSSEPMGLVDTRYAPVSATLTDHDLAVMAVGAGDWQLGDGPTTGVGNEMWFHSKDGATAYVCVDQGQVTACEITPAPAAAERQRRGA